MQKSYLSFVLLILAFGLSAEYQYYRSTINEIPAYDAFGTNEIIRFSILMAISFFALVNKTWSKWITLAFCMFCLAIVFAKYYPDVYVLRQNGIIDVLEPIIYSILIFAAALLSLPIKNSMKK
jgi:hypothetical protein